MDKRNEITKMMDEGKNETNGRSVCAFMHDEHYKIKFHHAGNRMHITSALASIIDNEKDVYDEVVGAITLVNRRSGLMKRLKLVLAFLIGIW